MVQCFKVNKEIGFKVREFLTENNFLDKTYSIGKTQRYLFFPVKEDAKTRKILKEFKGTIEIRQLTEVKKKGPHNLKEALKGVIPEDKIEFIRRGFEVVGDIAVLEIPPELEKLEKSISWTVKRIHPNINVVAKKASKTSGVYRIRKIQVLQGEKRSDTIYRESGLRMHVDLNKAYFSSKMSSERIRISNQVLDNENVLVMFAGIGPQGLLIAKQHPKTNVWMVELNPDAIQLMKENIRINYLGDKITTVEGDVSKKIPKLNQKFDRIVMVLPHENEKYLPLALSVAKKGAMIHMYLFAKDEDFDEIKKRIESEHGVKVKKIVKAGEYAPKVWRICLDIVV